MRSTTAEGYWCVPCRAWTPNPSERSRVDSTDVPKTASRSRSTTRPFSLAVLKTSISEALRIRPSSKTATRYTFLFWLEPESKTKHDVTSGRIERVFARQTGRVLPASAGQTEEPTLARRGDGWQMFYEAERGDRSLNASASGPSLQGPWTIGPDVLYPRAGSFDAWHLSPFALLAERDGSFVLFYNGATRDGRRQIGWCLLDEDCATVFNSPIGVYEAKTQLSRLIDRAARESGSSLHATVTPSRNCALSH